MIHPSSYVSPKAQIGKGVSIGAFTTVHDNVCIGDGTVIESYCEIGLPTPLADGETLYIGKNSIIRSHSVFYQGSSIGDNLRTGHHVIVREHTLAGQNFQLGTHGEIQGTCQIGDFVKCQSSVIINQHTLIGNYVWIFAYVVFTNDPHPPSETRLGTTIEDFAVIACMSTILPGVTVKRGALVAAQSLINRDVEPDTVVGGVPAKFICHTGEIKLRDHTEESAYPWRKHFHRGYPEKVVQEWLMEFGKS